MAQLTISVPGEYVDDLRRMLLRAHAERAEALRRALDAYLATHERFDDVEGTVVELGDLDAALAQLGWTASATPRPIALTVHPEVLADALAALAAEDGHTAGALRALVRDGGQEA